MKKIVFLFVLLSCCMFGIMEAKAAPVIADGTYKIQSALNSNKVLDVKGGKTTSGTNVWLYTFNNSDSQKWNIKHVGNNYYKITSVLDSKISLDVKSAGKKSGTNVQIYKNNNTIAQQWLIKYAGNGYYSIVSKCNNLYIDVNKGTTYNGTNIQMYKGNNTAAQKFKFIEILEGKQTIADGIYTINSALNVSKSLKIKNDTFVSGTDVQLYDFTSAWGQFWQIVYKGNGYYEIVDAWDGSKALDIKGGIAANYTQIQIYNKNNTDAQRWIIKDAGDGYYNIVSKKDNIYMDVSGGVTTNGTKIQTYHSNGTNSQKFKFTKIDKLTKITDGYYSITSKVDNSKVLGIDSLTPFSSANISLKNNEDTNTNKWYIKHVSGPYYVIQSAANTKRVIDIKSAGTSNGTNIQLYNSNNTDAQKWIIQDNLDGTFTFVAKNGKVIDIDVKSGIKDGTNIQLYTANQTEAQKFTLTPTTFNEYSRSVEDGYYTINSLLDTTKVVDVDNAMKANETNVQLYTSNKTNAQIWYLKYLNDGYYSITSAMSPKISLDVKNGATASGTNLQIVKANNSEAQQWLIKLDENNNATIIAKNSGLAIDVKNSSTVNKTNIQLATITEKNNQKFVLTPYTGTKIYKGIDISYHQEEQKPKVNWETISKSNLDFVIIRAGYGMNITSQDDKSFASFVEACEKYNIPYGLYLYSYAKDIETPDKKGAKDEAEHMLRLLNQIGAKNYRPNLGTEVFLDVEDKSVESAGKTKLTQVADYFCSTIESKGYKCGIYANREWFTKYINPTSLYPKYDIWIAEYFNKINPTFNDAINRRPTYNLTPYKYWQFASDGVIGGISGNVDLDLGYDIFD